MRTLSKSLFQKFKSSQASKPLAAVTFIFAAGAMPTLLTGCSNPRQTPAAQPASGGSGETQGKAATPSTPAATAPSTVSSPDIAGLKSISVGSIAKMVFESAYQVQSELIQIHQLEEELVGTIRTRARARGAQEVDRAERETLARLRRHAQMSGCAALGELETVNDLGLRILRTTGFAVEAGSQDARQIARNGYITRLRGVMSQLKQQIKGQLEPAACSFRDGHIVNDPAYPVREGLVQLDMVGTRASSSSRLLNQPPINLGALVSEGRIDPRTGQLLGGPLAGSINALHEIGIDPHSKEAVMMTSQNQQIRESLGKALDVAHGFFQMARDAGATYHADKPEQHFRFHAQECIFVRAGQAALVRGLGTISDGATAATHPNMLQLVDENVYELVPLENTLLLGRLSSPMRQRLANALIGSTQLHARLCPNMNQESARPQSGWAEEIPERASGVPNDAQVLAQQYAGLIENLRSMLAGSLLGLQ